MCNDRNDFETKIDTNLKNGENAGIVCMSSELANYYSNKYSVKYKTVLLCSKSDDKYKEKLKNVNEFWVLYQLLIYSPTVEAGVNFDIEHFNKIYVVLSAKSTSPRGLLQMCSRVRKIKDTNIMVYLNNIPFKEKSNFYTYDELKEYICEVYSKYLEPKTILDPIKNKMIIKYNFDLYAQILVHNETENANKCKNLFVPYFIKLLTEKGHTFEYRQTKINKNTYNKNTILKDEILKAGDITHEHFNTLLIKQLNNEATRDDKVLIERHLLKKDWKIKDITNEFIEKYYGKTQILYNLRFLLDKTKLEPYSQNNSDHLIDFDKAVKLEQIKMIEEIIQKLGFDKPGDDNKLSKEIFQENIKKVIEECQLFINTNKSQPMFGYDKVKITKIKTIKQFMGFINSLFSEWGIIINVKRKSIKNNKLVKKINYYALDYIDNINKYI